MAQGYPSNTKRSHIKSSSILNQFINTTQIDDIVLFRNNDNDAIYFGRIVSNAYRNTRDIGDDQDYKTVRDVKWFFNVNKKVCSEQLLKSISSNSSYYSISRHKDEIENLISSGYLKENIWYKKIVDKQKELVDIIPNKYDGSYQFIKAIIFEYEKVDPSKIDEKDLNLLYFSSVGTWNYGFKSKDNLIENSNLNLESKTKLHNLLRELESKTYNGDFLNFKDGKYVFGMFSSGMG